MRWAGVLTSFVIRSFNYVIDFSKLLHGVGWGCQLPTTLASLVRHLPSTLFSSLSTSNHVIISCPTSCNNVVIFSIRIPSCEWRLRAVPKTSQRSTKPAIWTYVWSWQWCCASLKRRFSDNSDCQNHGAAVTLWNDPPKIEEMKCPYLMASAQKSNNYTTIPWRRLKFDQRHEWNPWRKTPNGV